MPPLPLLHYGTSSTNYGNVLGTCRPVWERDILALGYPSISVMTLTLNIDQTPPTPPWDPFNTFGMTTTLIFTANILCSLHYHQYNYLGMSKIGILWGTPCTTLVIFLLKHPKQSGGHNRPSKGWNNTKIKGRKFTTSPSSKIKLGCATSHLLVK